MTNFGSNARPGLNARHEGQPIPQRDAPKQMRRGFGLLGSIGIGALLAIQSRINGTLGARLHDGVAAAVISFGIGLIVLTVLVLAVPAGRRGARRVAVAVRSDRGQLRWWQCLGGVCGGYLVLSQGLSAAALGVALFTVAVVAGQVASGLLVDRLGVGPGGPQAITPPRVVGAVLAVVAVGVALSTRFDGLTAGWLVVVPALAGIGTAWQQAVNGRVKETGDSAIAAAAINFATGTAALVLALAVEIAVRGVPAAPPSQAWLYTGGLLGIVIIGGASMLVRSTGVLLLSLGMIVGQLVGALALDLLVPTPGTRVATTTLVGIVLTLVAAGVTVLPAAPLARWTRRSDAAPDLRR